MMKFRPKQAKKNFEKKGETNFTLGKIKISNEEIIVKGWISPCDRYSKLKDGVELTIYFLRKMKFRDGTHYKNDMTNFFNYEFKTFEDAYIAAFDTAVNMRIE